MRRMVLIPILLLVVACSGVPSRTVAEEAIPVGESPALANESYSPPDAVPLDSRPELSSATSEPSESASSSPPPAASGAVSGERADSPAGTFTDAGSGGSDESPQASPTSTPAAEPSGTEEKPSSAPVPDPGSGAAVPGETVPGSAVPAADSGREQERQNAGTVLSPAEPVSEPDRKTRPAPPPAQGGIPDAESPASSAEEPSGETVSKNGSGPEPETGPVVIIPADALPAGAMRIFPKNLYPVMKRGKPLSVVFDFDGNGYTDVCVLGVAADSRAHADASYLSDFSRVFRNPPGKLSFSLELFLQDNGKLLHSATIPLDDKLVLDSMSLLPLSAFGSYPAAVAVEFLNGQGSEIELVVFPDRGDFSRVTLYDTPELHTHIRDIDADGILDLLLEERIVEAGTGYETFLTWFRWTGDEYAEKASVNIVRNLKEFLQKARDILISGNRQDFLVFALPDTAAQAARSTRSPETVISKMFTPASFSGNNAPNAVVSNPLLHDRRILDVVFPEVTENPFPLEGSQGYAFSLPLRIRFDGGEDSYYYATVELSSNPFTGKQYSFAVR